MSSSTKPSSWGQWGNKIAAVSRPRQTVVGKREVGVDIVGYGPIARALSVKLASQPQRYRVASITDSSGVLYPKDPSQVIRLAAWKGERRENKLADYKDAQVGAKGDLYQGIEFSKSSIVVDATNSDYTKHEEAKKRALLALDSGKHYVAANKVALAFHYGEVFDLAKRKGLRIGSGATNLGARHAIPVVQAMERDELTRVSALLNSATTMVLSRMEEDESLSMDQSVELARKDGVLESDPSIDLDGWDAAAKAAILANAVFPERRVTINEVAREGIRDGKAIGLIESRKNDPALRRHKIREVAEITREKTLVEPRLVEADSPLAIGGHSGVVVLESRVSGRVVVESTFDKSGVELTSSVLLSDVNQIASAMIGS